MNNCFFYVSKSMFYTAFKAMFIHHRLFIFSLIYSNFCGFNTASFLKARNLYNRASQFCLHCINMNLIAIFLDNIHHINSNYHRDSKFCKLGCKIKVSFQISSINNIQNCIRPFFYKIITRYNFFQCIWRKGIYTRQVHYYYFTVVALKFTFLLFYSYSRPVSHKLV